MRVCDAAVPAARDGPRLLAVGVWATLARPEVVNLWLFYVEREDVPLSLSFTVVE